MARNQARENMEKKEGNASDYGCTLCKRLFNEV